MCRTWSCVCAGVLLCGLGCGTMPGPAYPAIADPEAYHWVLGDGGGYAYCSKVEDAAREQAQMYSLAGWSASIAAIGTATIPAVISATNDNLSHADKRWNIILPVLSASLAAAALGAFTREDHDDQVAKEASLAMLKKDRQAMEICVAAVADWHGQRGEAGEAARTRMAKVSSEASSEREEEGDEPGVEAADLRAIPESQRADVFAILKALRSGAKSDRSAHSAIDELVRLLRSESADDAAISSQLRAIAIIDAKLQPELDAIQKALSAPAAASPVPPAKP